MQYDPPCPYSEIYRNPVRIAQRGLTPHVVERGEVRQTELLVLPGVGFETSQVHF